MTEVTISYQAPSDHQQWNRLCLCHGNLQQSVFYDPVQRFYNQHPVYHEVWENGKLLGGVKVFLYKPVKWPRITSHFGKYLLQAGEAVVDNTVADKTLILSLLTKALRETIREVRPVYFKNYGYYDQPECLLEPVSGPPSGEYLFANAFLDLTLPESQLWDNIHPHHKRKIQSAQKSGCVIRISDDPELFLDLLRETYAHQPHAGPNPLFVCHFFREMISHQLASVCTAYLDEKPLSSMILIKYGNTASYAFGGGVRSNTGASHLLHWEMIRTLRAEGFSRYFLGQVAAGSETVEEKFHQGITPFKLRFGARPVPSHRKTFTFKPFSEKIWRMMEILTGKK